MKQRINQHDCLQNWSKKRKHASNSSRPREILNHWWKWFDGWYNGKYVLKSFMSCFLFEQHEMYQAFHQSTRPGCNLVPDPKQKTDTTKRTPKKEKKHSHFVFFNSSSYGKWSWMKLWNTPVFWCCHIARFLFHHWKLGQKSLENTWDISIFMVLSSVKCKLSPWKSTKILNHLSWRTHQPISTVCFERLVSEFKVISPRNSSSFGVARNPLEWWWFHDISIYVHLNGLGPVWQAR